MRSPGVVLASISPCQHRQTRVVKFGLAVGATALALSVIHTPVRQALAETTLAEKSATKLSTQTGPLRIGIVGLVHGHVEGLLAPARERKDLQIVGVFEPNRALFDRLAKKYDLDPALYYSSLEEMLDATEPEVVSVMSPTLDHRAAVEACAPRGVHLFVEKPLAFTNEDARRIEQLAREHGVLVLTNFETSWYASLREIQRRIESGEFPKVRKMVFRHGHRGPQEIGCSPEFLAWLTDPKQNGGGAITDFGCYGAAIATWLMNGERPTKVTASAATLKPDVYPRVDDDATIVLTYPTATAVIQASWAWTHDNKEADVYTESGSLHAGKWDELSIRAPDGPRQAIKPAPKPPQLDDQWTYLRKVVRGECEVDPLSSLELNLIVADILDQARQAARQQLQP